MNQLTAVRTFAKPGYCPVKRTRIFNDRWYRVTMQNVDRDALTDYVGLGEGEYIELLPGNKARERRDAHLNHCNAIQEYNGPVWEAFGNQYGGEVRSLGFFRSVDTAFSAVTVAKESHDKWIADCERNGKQHRLLADAIERGEAKSIMSPELHRQSAEECDHCVTKYRNEFHCNVQQVV